MVGHRVLWNAGIATVFVLVAVVVMPARADHPIPVYEDAEEPTITFDPLNGNEWWVQVKVTMGPGGYGPSMVYARHESGTWRHLEHKWWGDWAASFRVPPGERVQFQAVQAGGMSDVWRRTSCFFTHPAGVEQCDPGATDNLKVSFAPKPGTANWEEVVVTSNRPLEGVSLMRYTVDGWYFDPMDRKAGGVWTKNIHTPQGTTVSFLALDGAETRRAGCYKWVHAEAIACPPNWGPNGGNSFMTRFDHHAGNEWWVEAKVGPVKPVRVLAQDGTGPWTELQSKSWGTWGASFHVEPGNKVRFQAVFSSTESYTSCWFAHPAGLSEPDGLQVCEHT